tara:strand:+ start:78 stop:428 length:351 start_codon:yes stop_codon:yes gene_type:complete
MSSREITDAKNGETDNETRYYRFKDPVVASVCDKFIDRSNVGFAKYGRTLHDERTGGHKDLAGYLNDVQEELMDAILYIQAARDDIEASMAKMMRFDCTSSKEICDNCSCNGYRSK